MPVLTRPHPCNHLSALIYIILSFIEKLSTPSVKSSTVVVLKAGQSLGLQKEPTDMVQDPFKGLEGNLGDPEVLVPPGLSPERAVRCPMWL